VAGLGEIRAEDARDVTGDHQPEPGCGSGEQGAPRERFESHSVSMNGERALLVTEL
jgi:hypothetical protein